MPHPLHLRAGRGRRGVTMIEMMIALTVLVVILTSVSLLMRNQAHALESHAGRLDAGYNARFAVNSIYHELRAAGSGVVDVQPMLVQADSLSVTFNADLVASNPADPIAMFIDSTADSSVTLALTKAQPVTLPITGASYPDTTYELTLGIISRAETISYWAEADTSTTRTDDYLVMRRVNNDVPRIVSRGVMLTPGQPMFRYFKRDTTGTLLEIPQSSLPLRHVAAIHGSGADTGSFALIDSIRVIKIHVEAVYNDRDRGDVKRSYERIAPVVNAGLMHTTSCGALPAAVAALNAVALNSTTVQLTWNPSADELGGEKDVERYGIFRRVLGSTQWGEPFASVQAAALTPYTLNDGGRTSLTTYIYAIVAQDCTPNVSSVTQSNSVTTP
ncbi:MAG: prepilin-type N-terminal cleavage/methylation domain-containing protein [Gemmatimonadaceae bacterium]